MKMVESATIASVAHVDTGFVTYEFSDGTRLALDPNKVAKFGLGAELAVHGIVLIGTLNVYQNKVKIGTLPGDFDPNHIKPKNAFFSPRAGDFRRVLEDLKSATFCWHVSPNLLPGDLEAIPGFVWVRE